MPERGQRLCHERCITGLLADGDEALKGLGAIFVLALQTREACSGKQGQTLSHWITGLASQSHSSVNIGSSHLEEGITSVSGTEVLRLVQHNLGAHGLNS